MSYEKVENSILKEYCRRADNLRFTLDSGSECRCRNLRTFMCNGLSLARNCEEEDAHRLHTTAANGNHRENF